MSHIHFALVMGVLHEERKSRTREKKLEYRKDAYKCAGYRSALEAIAAELADCDDRLDEISKPHTKYY